eukprot:15475492-Alexandrium_andersonii.AAC.1
MGNCPTLNSESPDRYSVAKPPTTLPFVSRTSHFSKLLANQAGRACTQYVRVSADGCSACCSAEVVELAAPPQAAGMNKAVQIRACENACHLLGSSGLCNGVGPHDAQGSIAHMWVPRTLREDSEASRGR